MTLRAILLALVAATVLAALATDAVVRSPKGPCNDLVALATQDEHTFFKRTPLSGTPVTVARAERRKETSAGHYEYELGDMTLQCEALAYAGNDAHEATYDACLVRPMNACRSGSAVATGHMFNAEGALLERDPATDTYAVRVQSERAAGVGTQPFKVVQSTHPRPSFTPLAFVLVSLVIAFHAAIVLHLRERKIATLQEGTLDEKGRVQPKRGGPAFAAAPHRFAIGDVVTFDAPAREPTYRAEDVVPVFASRLHQRTELKAIRFRAWLAIIVALIASTLVALFAR